MRELDMRGDIPRTISGYQTESLRTGDFFGEVQVSKQFPKERRFSVLILHAHSIKHGVLVGLPEIVVSI